MKISHPDLPEISRMIFVEIGPVMVLSSCHTTSARMFAVLAYTSMTGGDMTATTNRISSCSSIGVVVKHERGRQQTVCDTHCLRVFVNRVGIVSICRR